MDNRERALRELVATWREAGVEMMRDKKRGLNSRCAASAAFQTCADSLEAALSAAPAPDENALIDARERGYDDACSTSLPFSQDAEADFRKWRDLNPDADLRSAWIAGRANEAASQGVKLTKANVAGYEKGFKAAQEYFPEAALNKLVRDWEARVGEKPIERRGAYEAALDDCINELRSIAERVLEAAPCDLQRTAGDVLRQFRESGSEDWGELESAINWWLWNDALPTLGNR